MFYIIFDLMGLLLRPLLHIISYACALYILDRYTTLGGIDFVFQAQTLSDMIKVYLFLGVVFWFGFAIVKRIIKLFAFPLQILTLGLIGVVINIVTFYVCSIIINTYIDGVVMKIGSLGGLLILSFILSGLVTCIYRLLKKIF